MGKPVYSVKNWIGSIVILGALAFGIVSLALGIDYSQQASATSIGLIKYFSFSPEAVSNSIGVLSSIVAAVLGIVITVVSIVVQLSATRYTAAVTDIFIRDSKNRFVIGFYIVSCIVGLWIAFAVQDQWVPVGSLLFMLIIASLCFLLMPSYFSHVFEQLSPKAIVQTIQLEIETNLIQKNNSSTAHRQRNVLENVETLCDIAINSIAQKDRIIAIATVDALSSIAIDYLSLKNSLHHRWFESNDVIFKNPDYSSLAKSYVDDLGTEKLWFEFKLFRQYQTIYNEALGCMSIVNYEIAIQIRRIAEASVHNTNTPTLNMAVKFFNTFLRATINNKDVRTTYTILNQYRLLMESLIESGHHDTVLQMAEHMKYYGHIAYHRDLGFITETVAYDMGKICELVHTRDCPIEDDLIKCFLEIDPRAVDGIKQERSLQGVRKAQIKLASYYLSMGEKDKAKQIWLDMKDEEPRRLQSIKTELMSVSSKEFWEISERGENFDFLSTQLKAQMEEFFSWF